MEGSHDALYKAEYQGVSRLVEPRHFDLLMVRGRERRLHRQDCHNLSPSSGEKPMRQHRLIHVWSLDSFLIPAKQNSIFTSIHSAQAEHVSCTNQVIVSGITSCRLARSSSQFPAERPAVRLFWQACPGHRASERLRHYARGENLLHHASSLSKRRSCTCFKGANMQVKSCEDKGSASVVP